MDGASAPQALRVALGLASPLPEGLDIGAAFDVFVAVEGADLAGAHYEVRDDGGVVVGQGVIDAMQRPIADDNHDPRNGAIELEPCVRLSLCAPRVVGRHRWLITLPAQSLGDSALDEASLRMAFETREHRLRLVAWDAPSTVAPRETFGVKLGAVCSAGCRLAGRNLVVRHSAEGVLARARLGDATLPDAGDLFWCEAIVAAPAAEGLSELSASFDVGDFDLPHLCEEARFSVFVARAGEHHCRVTIVDSESGAPVEGAQVRLAHVLIATDAHGVAPFLAGRSAQRLNVWKAGYDIPERVVDIAGDCDLLIAARALPPVDPYARWDG